MHDEPDSRRLRQSATRALVADDFDAAADFYGQLATWNRMEPDDWYNLAYACRCLGRYDEAIDNYRIALKHGVGRAEDVHLNIAAVLSEKRGDIDGAKAELTRALSINPKFLPAWLNLGNLYEDVGAQAEAREAYRSALTLAPQSGRALARLAAIDLHEGVPVRHIAELRSVAESEWTPLPDAIEAGFGLGAALDSIGDYEGAFAAFDAANQAAREAADGVEQFSPQKQSALVQSIIESFERPHVAQLSRQPAPLFVCGMFRSGSTLAEQLLARHNRVTAGGELEAIPRFAATMSSSGPAGFAALSDQEYGDLAGRYRDDVSAIYPEYDLITDKRCDNFMHIGLIKAMFPDAKIIHTLRHPLDNFLSIYFGNFDPSVSYATSLDDVAAYYRSYKALMAHWKTLFPDDIYDLDYDLLVAHPAAELESLYRFCGLDWDPRYLKAPEAINAVRTLSSWQVRQSLNDKSSGRWRNYRRHVEHLLSSVPGQ